MAVIKKRNSGESPKTSLDEVISHKTYISEEIPVPMIHRDFLSHEDLAAVAVLDKKHRMTGFLSRNDWFEKMALWRESGEEGDGDLEYFKQPCLMLSHRTDPLDIWNPSEMDKLNEDFWFSVIDDEERFIGLFSSSDLHRYLLQISHRELDLAHQIQGRLNRKITNGQSSEYDVEFMSLPAKDIGGDLVYSRSLGNDNTLFALFDVSGKGHAAALVTGMIYGILSLAGSQTKLKNLLTVVNRVIFRTFKQEIFATAVIGIIHEKENTISLADMGHSHYYLLPSSFPDALSQSGSIPLGIEKEIIPEPEILEIPMKDGEELIIVSDGILEQESAVGQAYDIQNIFRILKENHNRSLGETAERIKEDFQNFIELKVQHDDASFLIVRRKKA